MPWRSSYDTPDGLAATRPPDVHRARRTADADLGSVARARRRRAWNRWQRSVFIDVADAVERSPSATSDRWRESAAVPPLAAVRSIMFVVDPVNTKRGMSSRLWIKRAALQRMQ